MAIIQKQTMVTDIKQLNPNKRYTYADYLTWRFDEMVELIRGKIVRMAPAPNMPHQWVSTELHFQIVEYLREKKCRAFAAPFDVRLKRQGREDTVVQPDLAIICDLSKLDQRGCKGAPDWIIEILSDSTSKKDLTDKFQIYQEVGVREYWVVHPTEGTVLPYRLDESGEYQLLRKTPFVKGEKVPVGIFPGFEIDLSDVFVQGLDL